MKKYIYTIFTTLSILYSNAQVGINTETPHANSMLEVKNQTNNGITENKTVLMPSVANKADLPKYNSAATDLYDDDNSMSAMVMYVKDKKDFNYYDGTKWKPIATGNKTFVHGIDTEYQYVCALGICGTTTVKYTQPIAGENPWMDELGITTNDGETFEISETGMYEISISMKINISGVSTWPTINLNSYVNGNLRNSRSTTTSSFILATNDAARISYNFPLFLKQGDNINFRITSDYKVSTIGATVKVKPNDNTNNITFRKYL